MNQGFAIPDLGKGVEATGTADCVCVLPIIVEPNVKMHWRKVQASSASCLFN